MFTHTLLISLAVTALLGVIFEEKIHINKAKTTLFCGTLSWIILFVTASGGSQREAVDHGLSENITEIATLWLFLLAAMTFVAYLNKKGMIETVIYLLLPRRISEKKLLYLTAVFCFLFSSLADNITATLCSIALILSLQLPPQKTLKFAVLAVFSVNSGGVALITGDVTTLMIFLAAKVEIQNLLALSFPSFIGVMILATLLSRGMNEIVEIQPHSTDIRKIDLWIAVIFLCTILGTIIGNVVFSVPPVLTFLFGLSLMFLVGALFKEDITEDPIMDYIRLIEFDTLTFFLGVLLVVGMLREIEVLASLTNLYHTLPHELANFILGALSAAIDNVPLTAAVLKSGIDMNQTNWLILTYSVGVGGSLLVIGSAAGIVAMSKVPGLTFGSYFRFVIPLCTAYIGGFGGTYLLGQLIFSG